MLRLLTPMHNARLLVRSLAFALLLAACSSVRSSSVLEYAGDSKHAISALEAEIVADGFKPICKEDAFCCFDLDDEVRVHFKATGDGVVLIIDILNGKDLAEDAVAARRARGEERGRAIWSRAKGRALEGEQEAARVAKAEAAREAAEEAEEARREEKDPESGVLNLLDTLSGGAKPASGGGGDSIVTGGVSASARCCINGAYYSCPSAEALNRCGGETAACLMRCGSSGSSDCEDECIAKHGPDPSSCMRESARDGECR